MPAIFLAFLITDWLQQWPTINGERPFTLPFGPGNWCHPLVTMHHMNSEEISSFWDFERRRLPNATQPLLLKDVFVEFVYPKLQAKREDWDNLSDDVFYLDRNATDRTWEGSKLDRVKDPADMNALEKQAHLSFEHCKAACASLDERCFQFRYTDKTCSMSRAFKMGRPVKKDAEKEKRMVSGWDMEKISQWIDKQGECGEIKWPLT